MDDNDIPRSQWEFLIDEWIFSAKDRRLLKSRILDSLTYEQLAEEYELSTRQVARKVKKLKGQLYKHR